MTRTRYRFGEAEYPHFMTWTIVGWLPIFTRTDTVQMLFDAWQYQQQEREFVLLGYVILENHVHLIASAPDLSRVTQSAKSYSAKQIIEWLEEKSAQQILRGLRSLKLKHKTESEYQVWQEGSHPQQLVCDTMVWQKLEYIHNNPVKRGYVGDPIHWRYSSASNYAGQGGLIDVVTDWM